MIVRGSYFQKNTGLEEISAELRKKYCLLGDSEKVDLDTMKQNKYYDRIYNLNFDIKNLPKPQVETRISGLKVLEKIKREEIENVKGKEKKEIKRKQILVRPKPKLNEIYRKSNNLELTVYDKNFDYFDVANNQIYHSVHGNNNITKFSTKKQRKIRLKHFTLYDLAGENADILGIFQKICPNKLKDYERNSKILDQNFPSKQNEFRNSGRNQDLFALHKNLPNSQLGSSLNSFDLLPKSKTQRTMRTTTSKFKVPGSLTFRESIPRNDPSSHRNCVRNRNMKAMKQKLKLKAHGAGGQSNQVKLEVDEKKLKDFEKVTIENIIKSKKPKDSTSIYRDFRSLFKRTMINVNNTLKDEKQEERMNQTDESKFYQNLFDFNVQTMQETPYYKSYNFGRIDKKIESLLLPNTNLPLRKTVATKAKVKQSKSQKDVLSFFKTTPSTSTNTQTDTNTQPNTQTKPNTQSSEKERLENRENSPIEQTPMQCYYTTQSINPTIPLPRSNTHAYATTASTAASNFRNKHKHYKRVLFSPHMSTPGSEGLFIFETQKNFRKSKRESRNSNFGGASVWGKNTPKSDPGFKLFTNYASASDNRNLLSAFTESSASCSQTQNSLQARAYQKSLSPAQKSGASLCSVSSPKIGLIANSRRSVKDSRKRSVASTVGSDRVFERRAYSEQGRDIEIKLLHARIQSLQNLVTQTRNSHRPPNKKQIDPPNSSIKEFDKKMQRLVIKKDDKYFKKTQKLLEKNKFDFAKAYQKDSLKNQTHFEFKKKEKVPYGTYFPEQVIEDKFKSQVGRMQADSVVSKIFYQNKKRKLRKGQK